MKEFIKLANNYIRKMSVKDMVLVKVCAWTMGFMFGIGLPQKHKEKASYVASGIFVVTYLVVTLPFLIEITDKEEKSCKG